MKKFLVIVVCALLAAVVVLGLGLFLYNIFDQSEHSLQVIPLDAGNSG